MLTEMCRQVLSAADIKAICKHRGFSAREASSRTIFESYFLSDIGLKAALASLTRNEITFLHLLKLGGQTVDICFFERLSPNKHSWHSTFTQRYTPVFKMVQNSLLRKGLLLIALAPGSATKMERWRFRFPQEFEAFLPPICQNSVRFDVAGEVRHTALRQRVMSILKDRRKPAPDNPNEQPVILDQGQLLIEKQPFSLKALLHWQQAHWQRSVWRIHKEKHGKSGAQEERFTSKPFPPLVNYAFSQLGKKEWVPGSELSTLLQLFYYDTHYDTRPPDSIAVCEVGWELGCLAKHTVEGREYYQLAKLPEDADGDPKHYLALVADSGLQVDLEQIPYQSLEYLAAISELKVVGAHLYAIPHPIKLGRASEATWNHPLTLWIRDNSTAFRKIIETIEARRGKQIIHTNLVLAKVKDLSLKVALEKAFSDPNQLLTLPNGFIAFPPERLDEIQRVIGKSGYVIKKIQAS